MCTNFRDANPTEVLSTAHGESTTDAQTHRSAIEKSRHPKTQIVLRPGSIKKAQSLALNFSSGENNIVDKIGSFDRVDRFERFDNIGTIEKAGIVESKKAETFNSAQQVAFYRYTDGNNISPEPVVVKGPSNCF